MKNLKDSLFVLSVIVFMGAGLASGNAVGADSSNAMGPCESGDFSYCEKEAEPNQCLGNWNSSYCCGFEAGENCTETCWCNDPGDGEG